MQAPMQAQTGLSDSERHSATARLTEFYALYVPEKLGSEDAVITKYENKIEELWDALEKKYKKQIEESAASKGNSEVPEQQQEQEQEAKKEEEEEAKDWTVHVQPFGVASLGSEPISVTLPPTATARELKAMLETRTGLEVCSYLCCCKV